MRPDRRPAIAKNTLQIFSAVYGEGVADAEHPGAPAPPPGGWPSWLDPSRDLLLTPRRLRGLVHPIRVRLLHLLEWWRTSYRSSAFSFRSPDDPGDAETIGLATQFMRLAVDTHHRRMLSYVDSLPDRLDELPGLPWSFSETSIELTHEQARALSAEVTAVVRRYQRERGAPPRGDGADRAVFQFQMLPDEDAS
jgi:hypothetical protein